MTDLINRQAAIDALMKRDKELRNFNWYDKPWAECECKGIDYALGIVNALPSVQPTQSNTSNALKTLDCIDRQAAIAKITNLPDVYWAEEPCVDKGSAVEALLRLPSAQPTLYGYDIKHIMLIAEVLKKENLPPERITEALMDIGRIVSIVRDEFEETLREAMKQCKI